MTVAVSACVALPTPSPLPSPSQEHPATSAPSPALDPDFELADFGWYHVDRVTVPGGNETRTLFVGSLDGLLVAQVPLGTLEAAAREGRDEAFQWLDPQADGVFGAKVVVWGRQGASAAVEAVSIESGATEPLVTRAEGTVHVATADSGLRRVFFVTIDEATGLPTGLWVDDVDDEAGPSQLDYQFSDQAVTRQFQYRLVANGDGTIIAVQPDQGGTVTLIPVAGGRSREASPGGPMLGFSDDELIAYGPASDTERPSVVAYSVATGTRRVLADEVDAARVVEGTEGPLLAVMRIDPAEPRRFDIVAIDLRTGESQLAYQQNPSELGPLLASLDRTFLGAEVPPDWVLLADSFFPYLEGPGLPLRDPPRSTYPMLLNLRTEEAIRLGPFRPAAG